MCYFALKGDYLNMKKRTGIVFTAIICLVLAFSLAGCSFKEFTPLSKQSDILTELRSKTADIGIMDSIMAENYIKMDANQDLMIIEDLRLTEEKYGIAFRKGSKGFIDKVNTALAQLCADGTMLALATKYNITKALVDITYTSQWDTLSAADKADFEAVKANGNMVLGYTEFEPIAYEVDKKLVGYDIEVAEKVAAKLGLTLKPQLIEWSNKITELKSGTIDCIWNGMTITDEITTGCEVTLPYLNNSQVALIRKADKEKYTKEIISFKGAKIVAESESAGELAYKEKIKNIIA